MPFNAQYAVPDFPLWRILHDRFNLIWPVTGEILLCASLVCKPVVHSIIYMSLCWLRSAGPVLKTDAWSKEQTGQLFREISMATNEQITPKPAQPQQGCEEK
jgi:hypothetical protein